jgi:chromosome segregation ATPase
MKKGSHMPADKIEYWVRAWEDFSLTEGATRAKFCILKGIKLHSLNNWLARKKGPVRTSNMRVKELEIANKELNDQLFNDNVKIEELRAEVKELKSKNQELGKGWESLQVSHTKKSHQIKQLETDLLEENNNIIKLEAESKELKRVVSQAAERNEYLHEEIRILKSRPPELITPIKQRSFLSREVEELQSQLAAARAYIKSLV